MVKPVADWRRSIVSKVNRAEKHFRELHDVLDKFRESKPYVFAPAYDPHTGRQIGWEVVVANEVPTELPLIFGDILHNLRSALDHMANAAVAANGAIPDCNTAFPIYNSASEFESKCVRKIKGIGEQAVDIIRSVQPYKGASNGDVVWRLHQLDIIDKHRTLLTCGVSARGLIEIPHAGQKQALFPMKVGHRFTVKSGYFEMEQEKRPAFDIALNEPQIMEAEPVVLVARMAFQRVWRIFQKFAQLIPDLDISGEGT